MRAHPFSTALKVFMCSLALTAFAQAHQVPNMTVEADFAKNRGMSLRINLDPRLVLSDQPTTLPPIPASWYQERSAPEQAKIIEDTRTYLEKNLELRFGDEVLPLPPLETIPIDGSDNKPISDATEEVHLLASGRAIIPGSAKTFAVRLGRESNVSLILLNRVEGQPDPSLRVVFPGETSQDFELTGVRSLEEVLGIPSEGGSAAANPVLPWMARGVIVLLLLISWLIFRNRWNHPRGGRRLPRNSATRRS